MIKKKNLIVWLCALVLIGISFFTDKFFFVLDKVNITTYIGVKCILFAFLIMIWYLLLYLFSKKGLRFILLFFIPCLAINLLLLNKIDYNIMIDNIKIMNLGNNYIANTLFTIFYMILPFENSTIYMESFIISFIFSLVVCDTKYRIRNMFIILLGLIPCGVFIYLSKYLVCKNYLVIYTSIIFIIYLLSLKNNRALFISSTGGHLEELLQLKPVMDKYDFYLVTEKTSTNKNLKNKFPKRVGYLVYGTRKNIIKYVFVILINIFKSLYIYFKVRPNVIVTTGTHTAVPMCFIGKIFGAKIIYIETFANRESKTLAGRFVYPIADLFIVQWEEMLKLYPKAKYFGGVY